MLYGAAAVQRHEAAPEYHTTRSDLHDRFHDAFQVIRLSSAVRSASRERTTSPSFDCRHDGTASSDMSLDVPTQHQPLRRAWTSSALTRSAPMSPTLRKSKSGRVAFSGDEGLGKTQSYTFGVRTEAGRDQQDSPAAVHRSPGLAAPLASSVMATLSSRRSWRQSRVQSRSSSPLGSTRGASVRDAASSPIRGRAPYVYINLRLLHGREHLIKLLSSANAAKIGQYARKLSGSEGDVTWRGRPLVTSDQQGEELTCEEAGLPLDLELRMYFTTSVETEASKAMERVRVEEAECFGDIQRFLADPTVLLEVNVDSNVDRRRSLHYLRPLRDLCASLDIPTDGHAKVVTVNGKVKKYQLSVTPRQLGLAPGDRGHVALYREPWLEFRDAQLPFDDATPEEMIAGLRSAGVVRIASEKEVNGMALFSTTLRSVDTNISALTSDDDVGSPMSLVLRGSSPKQDASDRVVALTGANVVDMPWAPAEVDATVVPLEPEQAPPPWYSQLVASYSEYRRFTAARSLRIQRELYGVESSDAGAASVQRFFIALGLTDRRILEDIDAMLSQDSDEQPLLALPAVSGGHTEVRSVVVPLEVFSRGLVVLGEHRFGNQRTDAARLHSAVLLVCDRLYMLQ